MPFLSQMTQPKNVRGLVGYWLKSTIEDHGLEEDSTPGNMESLQNVGGERTPEAPAVPFRHEEQIVDPTTAFASFIAGSSRNVTTSASEENLVPQREFPIPNGSNSFGRRRLASEPFDYGGFHRKTDSQQKAPSHNKTINNYFLQTVGTGTMQKMECGHCKNSGQSEYVWKGHNASTCQRLAKLSPCKTCGAYGENNHTETYCPQRLPVHLELNEAFLRNREERLAAMDNEEWND